MERFEEDKPLPFVCLSIDSINMKKFLPRFLREPESRNSEVAESDKESGKSKLSKAMARSKIPTPVEISSLQKPAVYRTRRSEEEGDELKISFDYQCSKSVSWIEGSNVNSFTSSSEGSVRRFAGISGAAISANNTYPNTPLNSNTELLFPIESPRDFIPLNENFLVPTDSLGVYNLSRSNSNTSGTGSMTPPHGLDESVLSFGGVQGAGGAAGEDRVQAVCSEDDGWLYCGIYDGFSGRDAADYLAANLYRIIALNLKLLVWKFKSSPVHLEGSKGNPSSSFLKRVSAISPKDQEQSKFLFPESGESFQASVKDCLESAIRETEAQYFKLTEGELVDRPELAMAGCCLLGVLVYGDELYTANLGDSRAVLATSLGKNIRAVQLTVDHSLFNEDEKERLEMEHPEEEVVQEVKGTLRVKGKLRVSRAFGAGYLKHTKFNDALVGMFKVKGMRSPPYISSTPYVTSRKIDPEDRFIVLGSDGLYDYFSNNELVKCVSAYLELFPNGDPAKFLIDELLKKSAEKNEISVELLKSIPRGEKRRKFHDDVTVVVISLENGNKSTATASMRF